MDETKALDVLSALANGVHPTTGEVFAADSPYQSPDVVRALFVVIRAFEARVKAQARRADLPSNAGKAWTAEEDQKLLSGFDAGRSIKQLADEHQRTLAGIQARLEKHGRLEPAVHGQRPRRREENYRPTARPENGNPDRARSARDATRAGYSGSCGRHLTDQCADPRPLATGCGHLAKQE